MQSMMAAVGSAAYHGVNILRIGVTDRTLIHTARNFLAEEFLATKSEWAVWFDSDMTFPPDIILTMLRRAKELNAKFLTGIYHQRMGEHKPIIAVNSFTTEEGHEHKVEDEYECAWVSPSGPNMPPFQVDACGFGCVLVHRSVFEAMQKPYFTFVFRPGKHEVSEDFYFCRQARKLGFSIWALPEPKLGHIAQGEVVTRDDYKFPDSNMVQIKTNALKEAVS
jgi:GT2 family glycosyltransferase